MKFDDLDTDILLALLKDTKQSTTQLAHKLLNPGSRHDIKKADSKIRYHTEKLRKAGLLSKNGVEYSINKGRVTFSEAKLHLAIGAEIPMGVMLVIIPKDGDVQMRQIFPANNRPKNQT